MGQRGLWLQTITITIFPWVDKDTPLNQIFWNYIPKEKKASMASYTSLIFNNFQRVQKGQYDMEYQLIMRYYWAW